MGEPEGRKGVDGGSQRPAAPPSLRRRCKLRRVRQAETRRSATPKLRLSVEGQVQVLEERSVGEIARLNLCYTQTAATLEHDGAVLQDLTMQLSWALLRIDVLKAAIMVGSRADELSAGVGASNDVVVSEERSRNFGDCDGSHDGKVAMLSDVVAQPLLMMQGLLCSGQDDDGGENTMVIDEPAALVDGGNMLWED